MKMGTVRGLWMGRDGCVGRGDRFLVPIWEVVMGLGLLKKHLLKFHFS